MKSDRFITANLQSYLYGKGGIILILVLLIGGFLAFYPSLSNDFQREWDDQWMVLNHPMILDHSLENIWYYFTHYDRGQYFPLNQLYYLGIYGLFGFSPVAFHLGSIIHMVNSLLVYGLIYRLSGIVTADLRIYIHVGIAFVVALIFAIHPLQVESVAWISASKVLLYSTFTLGSLISYLYYKKYHRIIYLILTFLGFILSLMSKEQAIILPVNFVLIDFLLHTYRNISF